MKLSVQNLYKTYQQADRAIDVLSGLTLEAEAGSTVAILGQSGSGKSTLLALLAGLDRPTSGQVFIGSVDMARLGEEELARFRASHMGIVFQQFHLMGDLTAVENVALPLELAGRPGADLHAAEALRRVGLGDRLHHFARQMSGGECQRVAIARALVMSPKILLADEPTGNLDFETARSVADLIFELTAQTGAILVLVTHNEELARRCQRQYRLAQGRLQ
jgi:putative ABC transport system ATP-binding protein